MVTKQGSGIEDIIGKLCEQVLALAHKRAAYNLRVFGSVARSEATQDSDIDVLVDWDYDRVSAWGGAGLYAELEELLGRKVDIASSKSLHPRIRDRVLKEAVPI
jgi:hypothetical protein